MRAVRYLAGWLVGVLLLALVWLIDSFGEDK